MKNNEGRAKVTLACNKAGKIHFAAWPVYYLHSSL